MCPKNWPAAMRRRASPLGAVAVSPSIRPAAIRPSAPPSMIVGEYEPGRSWLPGQVPAWMTVYRILLRHGLIDPTTRGWQRSDYRRWSGTRRCSYGNSTSSSSAAWRRRCRCFSLLATHLLVADVSGPFEGLSAGRGGVDTDPCLGCVRGSSSQKTRRVGLAVPARYEVGHMPGLPIVFVRVPVAAIWSVAAALVCGSPGGSHHGEQELRADFNNAGAEIWWSGRRSKTSASSPMPARAMSCSLGHRARGRPAVLPGQARVGSSAEGFDGFGSAPAAGDFDNKELRL